MRDKRVVLGSLYCVRLSDGKVRMVRAVDGEKEFSEPGMSHGFVHFADPVTGKRLGFSGVSWFAKNADRPVFGPAVPAASEKAILLSIKWETLETRVERFSGEDTVERAQATADAMASWEGWEHFLVRSGLRIDHLDMRGLACRMPLERP